ncbi:MAG: hypothetical protein H0W72_10580 [Planctomycetes bacterium]|nr:hypothetical protein [Planctomycetota bacterium]
MLLTYVYFLCGRRAAIVSLAEQPRLLWVGLLLVMSAALAREYDAEYLLAEPWHLLLSPLVSWAMATLIFALVSTSRGYGDKPRPGWRAYAAFIGLFWMMSPMAWLYGIPYERMLDESAAVDANLNTLRVLSLWRIFLAIRVVQVLFGLQAIRATVVVLCVANLVMLAALHLVPAPIFGIMGGIQDMTVAEERLGELVFLGKSLGMLAVLPLLITAAVALAGGVRSPVVLGTVGSGLRPLGWLGGAAILFWCCWLPWTQQEQRLRWRADQAATVGAPALVAELSRHAVHEYPSFWRPAPDAVRRQEPSVALCMLAAYRSESAEWVRVHYRHRLKKVAYNHADAVRLLDAIDSDSDPQRLAAVFHSQLKYFAEFHPDLSLRERAAHWMCVLPPLADR